MKTSPAPSKRRDNIATMPFLGAHGLLLVDLPVGADERKSKLATEIARLDKKAYRELGFGTDEWNDVLRLLVSAISTGLKGDFYDQSEKVVAEAEWLLSYYRELLPRNRVRYLFGTALGVVFAVLLGLVLGPLLAFVADSMSFLLIVAVCTLAALGSVASVLTRLMSITTLTREHSASTVVISGAINPTVAALIAVAVFLVLQSGVVSVTVGSAGTANSLELKLVVAFLCGFSERFGPDILAKISPTKKRQKNEKQQNEKQRE
jgi:hypothetical protein